MKVSVYLNFGDIMNNFFGILKVEKISDIIFDYYNKCKCYFKITCVDTDSKYNNKFLIFCNEKIIDRIYKQIKTNDYIYVFGRVVNSNELSIVSYIIKKLN